MRDASSFARDVLDALTQSGWEWALLHGLTRIESGDISDVDVAANPPKSHGISLLVQALQERRASPLLVWPYDVAGVGLFVISSQADHCVQLDLLVDPEGKGKYGLRTGEALRNAALNGGMVQLSDVDSWLYQARKRALKGELQELAHLLEHLPACRASIEERLPTLFSTKHAALLHALLEGRPPNRVRSSPVLQANRAVKRLRLPAGLWVHIVGEGRLDAANRLEDQFRPLVPRTAQAKLDGRRMQTPGLFRGPRPDIRLRPGLLITTSSSARHADVCVQGGAPFEAQLATILGNAAKRSTRQLTEWLSSRTP